MRKTGDPTSKEDILTTTEVCRLLRVTRPTLYSWIQLGRLAPWKKLGAGSTHLFLRSSLDHDKLRKYHRDSDKPVVAKAAPPVKASFKVLLFSRSKDTAAQVSSMLKAQNILVAGARSPQELLDGVREQAPDLAVLDMEGAPHAGWELLSGLRRAVHAMKPDARPALLAISRRGAGPGDAARALREGAWDFLRKPLVGQVFVARVLRLLRTRLRLGIAEQEGHGAIASKDGGLALYPDSRVLEVRSPKNGKPLMRSTLTRKEAELLSLFLRSPERVFSRRMLLEAVWGYVVHIRTRTVDRHVETLRNRLGPQRHRIETHYGLGYRFL